MWKIPKDKEIGWKERGSATVDTVIREGLSGDTFTEPKTEEVWVKPCGHQGEQHYRQRDQPVQRPWDRLVLCVFKNEKQGS